MAEEEQLHISYRRYIFFDSLWVDNPRIAKGFRSYISNGLKSIHKNHLEKTEEDLLYMKQYINTLLDWANKEYNQEQLLLKTLKDRKIEIPNLYSRGGFDYITFIKELNLVLQDEKKFEENIKTHKNNLTIIQHAIEKYKEELKNNPNTAIVIENKKKKTATTITNKTLEEEYLNHHIKTYSEAIDEIIKRMPKEQRLKDSVSKQIRDYVNLVFDSLKTDDSFIDKVSEILTENNLNLLQDTILEFAIQNVNKNISQLEESILNALEKQIKAPKKTDINKNWSNILIQTKEADKKTLKEIIERAKNSGEKLADQILELTSGQKYAFKDAIKKNGEERLEKAFKNLEDANSALIQDSTEDNKKKLAKA